MKSKILLLLSILLLGPINPVSAQILIEQGKVKLSVSPEQTISDIINIHNTSNNQTIKIKAYWEDFEYVEPFDGKKKFMPRGTSPYSCSQWISFVPQEFVLPPLGKKQINYSLRIPKDIKGGHYGVLFFETVPLGAEGNVGVQIVARVGSLFFIEPEEKNKAVLVDRWSTAAKKIQGTFRDKGNIVLIPDGTYYILNNKGIPITRGRIDKFYLPPNTETTFQFEINDTVPLGVFTAVVTFDLEDGDNIVKEVDFEKTSGDEIKILKVRD